MCSMLLGAKRALLIASQMLGLFENRTRYGDGGNRKDLARNDKRHLFYSVCLDIRHHGSVTCKTTEYRKF